MGGDYSEVEDSDDDDLEEEEEEEEEESDDGEDDEQGGGEEAEEAVEHGGSSDLGDMEEDAQPGAVKDGAESGQQAFPFLKGYEPPYAVQYLLLSLRIHIRWCG